MHHQGEAEVRRKSLGDGTPAMTMVVTAQHADVRASATGPIPFRPPTVILHVKASGRIFVTCDLMHALAEFWKRIGRKSGPNTLVGGRECFTTILTQVMATCGDSEMHAIASRRMVCMHNPPLPGCHCRECSWECSRQLWRRQAMA